MTVPHMIFILSGVIGGKKQQHTNKHPVAMPVNSKKVLEMAWQHILSIFLHQTPLSWWSNRTTPGREGDRARVRLRMEKLKFWHDTAGTSTEFYNVWNIMSRSGLEEYVGEPQASHYW